MKMMNEKKIAALLAACVLLLGGCASRQGIPQSAGTSEPSQVEQPSSSVSEESSQQESSEPQPENKPETSAPSKGSSSAQNTGKQEQWNLRLVSAKHPLKQELEVTLTKVGQISVDSRIAASLQDMIAAAKKEGYSLYPTSGHRTFSRSKTLYESKVKEYKNSGYGEQEALAAAAKWVAPPGTSEHNTGLAVDIITSDYYTKLSDLLPEFEEFAEAKWMKEHAHEFGFILRYPKNKEDITGINFEPWHFRYVGKESAKEIYERDLTLEEYLGVA